MQSSASCSITHCRTGRGGSGTFYGDIDTLHQAACLLTRTGGGPMVLTLAATVLTSLAGIYGKMLMTTI